MYINNNICNVYKLLTQINNYFDSIKMYLFNPELDIGN